MKRQVALAHARKSKVRITLSDSLSRIGIELDVEQAQRFLDKVSNALEEAKAFKRAPRYPDAETRLWSRVNKGGPVPAHAPDLDACWLWTGSTNPDGYGQIMAHGKRTKAHRLAWTITHGQIPEDLRVMHLCDTPSCVRPSHLRLGTDAENVADKVAKGRHARGERHGMAKVSNAQRNDILAARQRGERIIALARRYQISPQAIRRIEAASGDAG